MAINQIFKTLYARGLGDLQVMHPGRESVSLGYLKFDKGTVVIQDQKYLADLVPAQITVCYESGLIGMVAAAEGKAWESLTFFGLELCDLPLDLSKTRHSALAGAVNQYGETVLNFTGSIYRGYQLLLDNHFLPVVLLREVQAKSGEIGLAVADLRIVPMAISKIRTINDIVRQSIEKHDVLEVQDMALHDEDFGDMFKAFLPPPAPAAVQPQHTAPPEVSAVPAGTLVQPASASADTSLQDGIVFALSLLQQVAVSMGEKPAFAIFEQWLTERILARLKPELTNFPVYNIDQCYDLLRRCFEQFGERFTTVETTTDHIVHEIRDCYYREACLRAGCFDMQKRGTCSQVIPEIKNRIMEAAGGAYDWNWIRCDRRPGQPCLFEIRKRGAGK